MSYLYWIAVIISVIAFGGMSKGKRNYKRSDGKWIWLFVFSYISAIWLSGKFIVIVITTVSLFFGNALFWSLVWGLSSGIMSSIRIRHIIKETGEKEG